MLSDLKKMKLGPMISAKAQAEKQQQFLLREREKERERKEKLKDRFFYQEFTKEQQDSDPEELLDTLEEVKKEDGILEVLKWLKMKFEEAQEQRRLENKSVPDNFCFPQPEEWTKLFKKEVMAKFFEVMEVMIPSENNWIIPGSITDYGLKYKVWLLQITIEEIIILSPKFDTCQTCKEVFKCLPQHLNNSKECKEKYSEQDLEELKESRIIQKKNTKKDYYKDQKQKNYIQKRYQKKKSALAEKYLANKEEIAKKKAEHYQKNKSSYRLKNSSYYAQNRDKILKKRAESYQSKKAAK